MAYSRGQPNFVGAVDSRDGYGDGSYRMQNEIHAEVGGQRVNVPVVAASGSWYPSATYPGLRGGSGTVPIERDGPGRLQVKSVVIQRSVPSGSEPASTMSYRTSVQTQLVGSTPGPPYSGTRSTFNGAAMSPQNSAGPYVGSPSSLPYRKRSDGSVVPTESYPTPVSSQVMYTSRVMSGGPSGVAGKVAVASSRRTVYQPAVLSDATPVNRPQLRQIPVVVMPNQSARQDAARELQDQRIIYDRSKSYQESPSPVGSMSRSLSVNPTYSKEAEVDALTDLLVQNMNVAGNPDFCGTHFSTVILKELVMRKTVRFLPL